MEKHIQIKNSYNIWRPNVIKHKIWFRLYTDRLETDNYVPYIIEWWLHNIAYWLTKLFVSNPFMERLNSRAKDVDLMIKVTEIK